MANPTPAERQETFEFAVEIVAAVEGDRTIENRELNNATRTFDDAKGDFYEADAADGLLARLAQEVVLLRDELEMLRPSDEVLEEGYWHPCTGCYETEDGHQTNGPYHYSDTLKCPLGLGCHECGGIGAVWDVHIDPSALDEGKSE